MSVERTPRPEAQASLRPLRADFRLADRLVRPALNRVISNGTTLQLEPKVMQVLLSLCERPGQVVRKEELFRDVWEGAFVTEDVLTRAVGELRRAFGDEAGQPRVIETIRKAGYRLVAPVEPIEASASSPEPPAPAVRKLRGSRALAPIAAGLAAALLIVLFSLRSESRPAGPTRVRPITSLPGNERDPAVSPDGTRVAFAWNGGSGDFYSLYVKLVDGDAPLRLTNEAGVEDRVPAWSADGQRLAFTRATANDCRILLVSALGGGERPIAPCGDREYRRLDWSPDGKWLAFPSRRSPAGPIGITLLSPDTLERRMLTAPPETILGDSSPAFSPDGATLAFSRNITEGVGDLHTVPVSGGEPVRVTFDNRDTMGVSWSADGKSLVFSSSRAGIYSLWRVKASGGEPTWIAGGGMKMKHPSSARAKNAVAFENWLYEVNLWRVPLRSSAPGPAPRRLTEGNDEWNFEPALSPDGGRVAFVSTRSGSPELWVSGAESGADARKLTSFGAARLETPRWSPDGSRIVFCARRETRAGLWIVDASGGVPQPLTSDTSDDLVPSFSRDGKTVYFASRRSGSWQVWALRLADRRAVRVTSDGGYAAQESPDGRTLYFMRPDRAGLWSLPVAGGAATRVVSGLAPEDWANWEVGRDGLYYRELCASHRDPAMAFLAFGTSEPVHLAPLPDQGWSGFSVSADGGWLVYPRVDRHTCDIRLIENAP